MNPCVISGFRHNGGNSLPTLRDNLLVPSSPLNMGPIGCPEMSVMNYHYSLRNGPVDRSSLLLSPCLWESYIAVLIEWVKMCQNIDPSVANFIPFTN